MRRLPALALVFVMAVAACGDSGGGDGDGGRPAATGLQKRIHDASDATRDAKTARVAGELDVDSKGQKLKLTIDGEWNFTEKEGRRTLSGPVVTELIVKGGVLYTKNPQPADPARPWTRQASSGSSLGTTDPEQALTYLLGAKDVKAAGSEDVRGETTEKYTVTIDLEQAVDALPDGESQALERSTRSVKEKEFPAEVWLDGQGRMRRLRYGIGGSAEEKSPVVSTIELYDFGVPVTVDAPPADQVAKPS